MTTFFRVNSSKTLIWSFSLFWGGLGPLGGQALTLGVPRRLHDGPKLQYISPHKFFIQLNNIQAYKWLQMQKNLLLSQNNPENINFE